MKFSRSRRTTGLGRGLAGIRRALAWGVVIAVALKADAPKRLRELYQSLSGGSGSTGQRTGRDAGGRSATPEAETPSVGAGSAAPAEAEPAASPATGGAGLPADASTEAEDVTDASTGLDDAAGYEAPDAQGLVLMGAAGETEISDQEPDDAGATDTGSDTTESGEPSGGEREEVSASGTQDQGDQVPGIVTEDQDAVPGDGTTECPAGFPIKGNGRSRLYHMPEGFAYARTKPEVCFRTPEAAEQAGFRRAKG